MKRARRMFKQIDCTNIREASQKVVAERAYVSTRNLHTLYAGNNGNSMGDVISQYNPMERRSRRTQNTPFGVNRYEASSTRFSMSPMDELISVTRPVSHSSVQSSQERRTKGKNKRQRVCIT